MHTRRLAWWNRLGIKLPAAITLVTIITFGVFLVLMLSGQRRHLMAQALRSAAVVSDTISSSIQHDMLQDRREDAYRIMASIGREDRQIDRLRLFDAGGRIRFSTDAAEIGTTPDINTQSCHPCHMSQQPTLPLTIAARTHLRVRDGRQILGAVTPIYNQPACSTASCHAHPPSQRIVGVLELGLTLDAVELETARLERTTIGLSLLATFVIAALTFVFARRFVVQPVRQLVRGTVRVSQGNLEQQVPVSGEDELGMLASSFNEMARALETAHGERNALLESLEQQVVERTGALEKAHAQLVQTEKLSSLGKLSASIAHEINNPLTGILTTAKLIIRMLESREDNPQRASLLRQLRLVQREAERCTAIVRNLLGFARERPLMLSDADVNAALDEALFLTANQIALQNIQLERDTGKLPAIHADFGQIRQAFVNVIINAVDAMPKGGTLRIATRHLAEQREIEVEIADTGCGIPREQLSKVVDPFFTTKEKGTGLGLSVVYGIVERHGGRLTIHSEVNVGTTVLIRLAISAAQPAVAAPAVVSAAG